MAIIDEFIKKLESFMRNLKYKIDIDTVLGNIVMLSFMKLDKILKKIMLII